MPLNAQIKILDTKELLFDTKKGIPFHEISDLAYKDGFVYFVSDQGYLYRFRINIDQNKIATLEYLNAYILKNKRGQRVKKSKRDAEGLVFYKDNLLISFERKHRITLYNKEGLKIKKITIHKDLQNRDTYAGKNKGLEAVAYNEKYGVITAPELPLENTDTKYHTLYTKNTKFNFRANGNIVSLEFFDKESIFVLLREFNYLTRRRITTLVKVYLNRCSKNKICKSEVVAKLDSAKGWKLDNFEGLTRIGKNRYLMISDDNDSIFQKTLLVLFEIRD